MKEVNFVLYFGANRGENALNNPQTVTTYANSDAVTREKENLFKAIYRHLSEMAAMGYQFAETSFHPTQTCFKAYQTTLVEPIVYIASLNDSNKVGIFLKGLEKNTDIEFKFLLDMELHIKVLRNLECAVECAYLSARKNEEQRKQEEERKRKEEQTEMFETLLKNSPYLQMNLNSRDKLLEEIIQKQQLLNRMDRDFLQECEELMQKLSGKETAANFVEFMKHRLNS